MTLHAHRTRFVEHAAGRMALAAALLALFATTAAARPRVGFEVVALHAREADDGFLESEGFPISGSSTLTFRWRTNPGLDVVTGLGYEDRSTRDRQGFQGFPGYYRVGVQRQWKSVVIPLRAAIEVGRILRLEAGPEWRWLLQSRTRFEDVAIPFVKGPTPLRAQAEIFEQASYGAWWDATSAYHRSSFALSLGASAHWAWLQGDAGVGFRWSEGLGNQLDQDWVTSRVREFQLVMSWDR